MDPVSQGALGAAAALALFARNERLSLRTIAGIGALSAMAPDLDVLIRSESDPLLAIKYHRHFSHSLAFVPLGATLALLPWLASRSVRRHLPSAWIVSATGYVTHAPLDCCTTYGTLWFWPFSDYRVALSWVSVVDPVYTLPLLGFLLGGLATRQRRRALFWARVGLALSSGYLLLGATQHQAAAELQRRVARSRGHSPDRQAVLTTFMNQVTWRSLYEHRGRIFVDELRVPYLGPNCFKPGGSLPATSGPPPNAGPKVERGYRLMRWFSKDWVYVHPDDPQLLADARYSLSPHGLEPFWGVEVQIPSDSVDWVRTGSERKLGPKQLFELIFQLPRDAICE